MKYRFLLSLLIVLVLGATGVVGFGLGRQHRSLPLGGIRSRIAGGLPAPREGKKVSERYSGGGFAEFQIRGKLKKCYSSHVDLFIELPASVTLENERLILEQYLDWVVAQLSAEGFQVEPGVGNDIGIIEPIAWRDGKGFFLNGGPNPVVLSRKAIGPEARVNILSQDFVLKQHGQPGEFLAERNPHEFSDEPASGTVVLQIRVYVEAWGA